MVLVSSEGNLEKKDNVEDLKVMFSEMVATELLSTRHGQEALKAVHRFVSHNPEWVGQTCCAGLSPETEDQSSGLRAEYKVKEE